MIAQTEQLQTIPYPVNGCIQMKFQADDFLIYPGDAASVCFLFENNQPNPPGLIFEMLEIQYSTDVATTNNTVDLSSNSSLVNAVEFLNMLESNFLWKDYDIELMPAGNGWMVCLTNCEVGIINNWFFDFTEFENPPTLSGTTGNDLNSISGYNVWYQLYCIDEDGKKVPVCNTPDCIAPFVKDGEVLPICVDFSEDIKSLMGIECPFLGCGPILQDAFKKEFCVKYGNFQDDINTECGRQAGPVFETSNFTVQNSVIRIDDTKDLSAYGFEPGVPLEFLTIAPDTILYCKNTCQFLTICLDVQAFYQFPFGAEVTYFANTNYYGPDGNVISFCTHSFQGDGVYTLPVNQQIDCPADACEICYQIVARVDFGPFLGGAFELEVTEEFCIKIAPNCCCDSEILFLDDLGSFPSIPFCIKTEDIDVQQTEICVDIPCGSIGERLTKGGKSLTNTKAIERISLESDWFPRRKEEKIFLKSFKKSEVKLIKHCDVDGNVVLKKFLVEPGGCRVYQKSGKIKVEVNGYLHHELPAQSII